MQSIESCVFHTSHLRALSKIFTCWPCFAGLHVSVLRLRPPHPATPQLGMAVGATVNILDWKLVIGCGAFSRMFAAANC